MIRAVIFDLDDTLTPEEEYIKGGFGHIAEILSESINIEKKALWQQLIELYQNSPKNVFNRLFENLELSYKMDDIIRLVQAYRNYKPKLEFYDDVLLCLGLLKANGIKTGIVSDGFLPSQINKLEALQCDKYFDRIILTEELGKEYGKPHIKAFEIMSQDLKVPFYEMLYVGDNPEKDFYISSGSAIRTVRIIRENSVYRNSTYKGNRIENFRINNLMELIELIENL